MTSLSPQAVEQEKFGDNPASLAPPHSAAGAARQSPVGSRQLQVKTLAGFGGSLHAQLQEAILPVVGWLAGFCCCEIPCPSCQSMQACSPRAVVWRCWLWKSDQRNLLTPGVNAESLREMVCGHGRRQGKLCTHASCS